MFFTDRHAAAYTSARICLRAPAVRRETQYAEAWSDYRVPVEQPYALMLSTQHARTNVTRRLGLDARLVGSVSMYLALALIIAAISAQVSARVTACTRALFRAAHWDMINRRASMQPLLI